MVHNSGNQLVGVVVCKIDNHKSGRTRGYIGMLAVDPRYRKRGIASILVKRVLDRMKNYGTDECVLEAEITNQGALKLYRRLGFVRTKLLHNYYLSGSDAFRLKLFFTPLSPVA
jgi:peptide alpha-N-acetyltransferase